MKAVAARPNASRTKPFPSPAPVKGSPDSATGKQPTQQTPPPLTKASFKGSPSSAGSGMGTTDAPKTVAIKGVPELKGSPGSSK